MTTNTIKSMSKATVEYIASKLNCTADKQTLNKLVKTKADEMDKLYAEAKAQQKAEADERKKQKAEELAKKAEALAKAEQKQKAEQQKQKDSKKDKKQKQTAEADKKQTAEAEKLSSIKAQYRKNSLQLNEQQAELLKAYINDFEIMRWKCNKNMITLYYNNKQAIELVVSRSIRISTKEAFATSTYEKRNSGYGIDFTKKLKDEKALATELKALVERVKKQTAKAEADKQKKADKKQKEDK